MSANLKSLSFQMEATAQADIQPVPYPYAGSILSRMNLIIANVLVLIPPLLTLGALVFVGFSIYGLTEDLEHGRGDPLEHLPLIVGGSLAVIALGFLTVRYNTMLGNLYLLRVARNNFRFRPDSIVNPDEPDVEFVEIVPRENWKKFMLDTASDTGFLRLDFSRREFLFEGDNERYRIPGAAIGRLSVEPVLPWGVISESDALIFVILRVSTPGGPREISFAPRGQWGMLTRAHREAWAARLANRLLALATNESPTDDYLYQED